MAFVVVYDACVLYSAPLRDLLVRLANTGVVRARSKRRSNGDGLRVTGYFPLGAGGRIREVMERVDVEHGVERGRCPRKTFGHTEPEVAMHSVAGTREHFRGSIETGHIASGRRKLREPFARAAPDLEHMLAVGRPDHVQHRGADAAVVVKRVALIVGRGDSVVVGRHQRCPRNIGHIASPTVR